MVFPVRTRVTIAFIEERIVARMIAPGVRLPRIGLRITRLRVAALDLHDGAAIRVRTFTRSINGETIERPAENRGSFRRIRLGVRPWFADETRRRQAFFEQRMIMVAIGRMTETLIHDAIVNRIAIRFGGWLCPFIGPENRQTIHGKCDRSQKRKVRRRRGNLRFERNFVMAIRHDQRIRRDGLERIMRHAIRVDDEMRRRTNARKRGLGITTTRTWRLGDIDQRRGVPTRRGSAP